MRNKTFSKLIIIGLVITGLGIGPSRSVARSAAGVTETVPGPQGIVLLDNRYVPHHVPPPPQEVMAVQTANFQVNWNPSTCSGSTSSWSNEAKAAFSYAVSIWAGLLDSSQTIEVDACWRSDLGSGVLGAAGTTSIHRDFPGAPVAGTWYPAALTNALTNSDMNGDTAEIKANFSSTFNWYYGTDGNTPSDQVDFVSVVLHELGHGLGFYGMGNVSLGRGTVRYSGYPGIYDQFTEDGEGTPLLNYTNNSIALGNALTGKVSGVYFDGTYANAANGNARVKLYTPSPWQEGSSYSHLDEIFNNTPNALMTYSLGYGESEHSPGPVMLGMFEDMGWTLAGTPVPAPTVTAITPNSGYAESSVSVAITGTDFQEGATVKLTKSGESDIIGINVNVASETQITCDFSLAGAATGQWNVVVTNPDSQSGTLPNGFTVNEQPKPDVTLSKRLIGSDFQAGDPITFVLTIANVGNRAASNPVVVDDLPEQIATAGYASTLSVLTTGGFQYTWNVEELSPGETGVITIYAHLSNSATFPFVNTATISNPGDADPSNNTGIVIVGGYHVYLPLAMRE